YGAEVKILPVPGWTIAALIAAAVGGSLMNRLMRNLKRVLTSLWDRQLVTSRTRKEHETLESQYVAFIERFGKSLNSWLGTLGLSAGVAALIFLSLPGVVTRSTLPHPPRPFAAVNLALLLV